MYAASQTDSFCGKERVLLVDDDKHLLPLLKSMLESLGFEVTAIIDSRNALELFQNTPHDYDLLISDFAMPDLTGDQLAARVIGIRQDIPVVLISGYTNEIDEQKSKRAGIKAIIQKPFVREELSRAIQSVLDGK